MTRSLPPPPNRYEFLLNVPPDCPVSGQVDTSPLAITSHYAVGTVVGSAKGLFGKDLTAEQEVWVFAGAEEEGQSSPFCFNGA